MSRVISSSRPFQKFKTNQSSSLQRQQHKVSSLLEDVTTEVETKEEETKNDMEPERMVRVTFRIARETEFGQHLSIIGAHPILGEWDVAESVPMDWVEGCTWEVHLDLPHFELIEYKYVIRCGWGPSGDTLWQGGPNYMLATNQSLQLEVVDEWVQEVWPGDHPVVAATSAAVSIYAQEHPKPKHVVRKAESLLPEWAENAVFYQLYPLGFFGAPTLNDLAPTPVPRLAKLREYYGYFKDLGVTAVYFSPLFESDTHGYDTADYFQIDRRMGDVALFKEIVDELHSHGMRVVLDGVFNHTGRRHPAFVDVMEKGPHLSEYANWYTVGARPDDYEGWCEIPDEEHGFSYDCWEGHAMLPKLNHAEPAVREHIFEVARFWLKEIGVDGWRLDVAHEMSPDFWREFRTVCMEANPDCLLVGEMIHGNYNNWVGNDRLHSGTNYQLSRAIWHSVLTQNFDELSCALLREEKVRPAEAPHHSEGALPRSNLGA
ncbi:hypothetical protein CYMTET_22097 [Cymbomonas tetramitiformis]|uniref:CBM20 domain-containing protein n=1 Tax=Cymbomonas tetramitiformis TaxID=36881 RepID=A0AAE0L2J2_9CHLO|nr:hypothetical protein CYMTET_22097 [Cymbomonas tetramitiformis]